MITLIVLKFLMIMSIGWLAYFTVACVMITRHKYWGLGNLTPIAWILTSLSAGYLVTMVSF